ARPARPAARPRGARARGALDVDRLRGAARRPCARRAGCPVTACRFSACLRRRRTSGAAELIANSGLTTDFGSETKPHTTVFRGGVMDAGKTAVKRLLGVGALVGVLAIVLVGGAVALGGDDGPMGPGATQLRLDDQQEEQLLEQDLAFVTRRTAGDK